jgi:serine/threonine-protein kinase PpkA
MAISVRYTLRLVCTFALCGMAQSVFAQDTPDPQQLRASIEEQIEAYEAHVVGLETATPPEGSSAAIEEAISLLNGGRESASRAGIEQLVIGAARNWVAFDQQVANVPDAPSVASSGTSSPLPPPALVAPTEPGLGLAAEVAVVAVPVPTPVEGPAAPGLEEATSGISYASFSEATLPNALAEPGRVLTLPQAQLISFQSREELSPFTIFYVHGQAQIGGEAYIAVGRRREMVDGWIAEYQTEEWRSMLVMEYAPSANRERVVFFKEADDVRDVLRSHFTGPQNAEALYRAIDAGTFDNERIIAIEPGQRVFFEERPYLMPILDFERDNFDDINETPVFLLELGAVNLQSRSRVEVDPVDKPKTLVDAAQLRNLKIAVVFVVDTTQSMGPYIQEVKRFLTETRSAANAIAPGQIDFGIVGYRDNTSVDAQIGYVTRTYLPLGPRGSDAEWTQTLESLQPSRVSTRNWREDAFAGIADALTGTNWSGYEKRFMIVVTDAGPRAFGDSLARDQQLGARAIGREATQRRVELSIFHMMTEAGRADHSAATNQYNLVNAALDAGIPGYWQLRGETPSNFGETLISSVEPILTAVRSWSQGQILEQPQKTAVNLASDSILADIISGPAIIESDDDADAFGVTVGQQLFAAQQIYLGKLARDEAPDFYRAWVADRDLVSPAINVMQVKVLMDRDQMSDLSSRLGEIVRRLDNRDTGTNAAFRDMASLSGVATYDPSIPVSQFLPEYLADLPYGSRFMNMSEEIWSGLGQNQQDEILVEVRDRIQLLENIYNSDAGWLVLPGRGSLDALFPLALNDLP